MERNAKKQQYSTGFTLVEVIVTLTILALISATVVPAFSGYIDKAQKKKCDLELAAIQKQFAIEAELQYMGEEAELNAESLLAKAVKQYGGTPTGGMSFITPCGTAGGKAIASEDGKQLISIRCPKHSGEIKPIDIGKATIETIVTNKILDEYFADRTGKNSLDSNGKNFAPFVNETLGGLGFDQTNCDWRVWVDTGTNTMQIYWTDQSIDDLAVGTKVRFVKYTYEYSTKTLQGVSTGNCTVQKKTVEGKTFTVLNTGDKAAIYDQEENASWPE